jgi:ribosomal protein L7/L12
MLLDRNAAPKGCKAVNAAKVRHDVRCRLCQANNACDLNHPHGLGCRSGMGIPLPYRRQDGCEVLFVEFRRNVWTPYDECAARLFECEEDESSRKLALSIINRLPCAASDIVEKLIAVELLLLPQNNLVPLPKEIKETCVWLEDLIATMERSTVTRPQLSQTDDATLLLHDKEWQETTDKSIITAIKRVRILRKAGLAEAKSWVEKHRHDLGIPPPALFTTL